MDPGLFRAKRFRLGITGQMLQQIALGGLMITVPIFLQMVFLLPVCEERVSEAAGVNSAGGSFGLSFGLAFAGAIMLASLSGSSPTWPRIARLSCRPSRNKSPTRSRTTPR